MEPLRKKGAITVAFDVNASQDAINAAAKDILDSHGPVDVVLNNAGYIFTGTMEEVTYAHLSILFITINNISNIFNMSAMYSDEECKYHI